MPRSSHARLADQSFLRSIRDDILLDLLRMYATELETAGFRIPQAANESLDYKALSELLMGRTGTPPPELVDAMHYIRELDDGDDLDALRRGAAARNLNLFTLGDISPIDYAAIAWLRDKELVKTTHAEMTLERRTSFLAYRAAKEWSTTTKALEATIPELTERVADNLRKRDRGSRTLIWLVEHGTTLWLIVRHGGAYRRVETSRGDETEGLGFWPVEYDLIIVTPDSGEIQINSRTPQQADQLRRVLGAVLLVDAGGFQPYMKYSLQPLRRRNFALSTEKMPELESVTLGDIDLRSEDGFGFKERLTATNLIAALTAQGRTVPARGIIHSTKFYFKFLGDTKPRPVTVTRGNKAEYARAEDAVVVEEWLRRTGLLALEPSAPCESEFWRALEVMPGFVAPESMLRQLMPKEVDWATPLFLNTDVVPLEIGVRVGQPLRVVHNGGRDMRLVSPDSGEVTKVRKEEILLCQVDLPSLGRKVAQAFGFDGDPALMGSDPTILSLGDFVPCEACRFPAFLVLPHEPTDVRRAVDHILANTTMPLLLLCPRRQMIPGGVLEFLHSHDGELMVVEECLAPAGTGEFELTVHLQKILKKFLGRNMTTLDGDPAVTPFPTPPRLRWEDLSFHFLDGHRARASIGDRTEIVDFAQLHMVRKRNRKPDDQWILLRDIAADTKLPFGKRRALNDAPHHVRLRLAHALSAFFGLRDAPFKKTEGVWVPRFELKTDQ